jgi:Animal haem peroxidase
MATIHGAVPRGLMATPRSQFHDGRFGRLFRHLQKFEPDEADLIELADTVIEKDIDVERNPARPSNIADPVRGLSAGFTYLGQFIDHDLTFDPVSQLDRINDPDALRDFRTPRFDLDSVYGGGPDQDLFLYDPQDRTHLLPRDDDMHVAQDLQRNAQGTAIIGDPRNDENSIVANFHLAFIKFHNKVVKALGSNADFNTASQIVRFHYQWLVVHDFLARVVGADLVNEILVPVKDPNTGAVIQWNGKLRFYTPRHRPFMPVEFSAAAYRFGHSMVRFNYTLNKLTDPDDTPDAKELRIFTNDPTLDDLRGGRPLTETHRVAWFRFLSFNEKDDDKLQPARTIDTQISGGLGLMPRSVGAAVTGPTSLAVRNLLRGRALGLPTGQDVAYAMGIPEDQIISNNNSRYPFSIGTGYKDDESVPDIGGPEKSRLVALFGDRTPLWYYILKEAELLKQGQMLGPVGGRIVAEVFIGLLLNDPQSYLVSQPNFRPQANQFGAGPDGKFGIAELIDYAVGSHTND